MIVLPDNYYYKTKYHFNIFEEITEEDVLNYDNVKKLEDLICEITGAKYCLTTCNGQTALYVIMQVLGLNSNHNIIIPDWSYPAFYRNAKFMNLGIRYADIKKDTLSMDPDEVESLIDENTKAIGFINHLGYLGKDIERIREMCDKYNLYFIEDSAHGLGAVYKGKYAGTFGDMSIFSFSGSKLIRSGEGGCLCTNNKEYYEKAKHLVREVMNFTMSPILAKIIYLQLANFDWYLERNKFIRDCYKKYGLKIYENETDNKFSLHVVYMAKNPVKLTNKLKSMNIPFRYKYYKSLTHLPVATEVEDKYIELPCTLTLTEKEISKIVTAVKLFDR